MKIRSATVKDAEAIARIHVDTWRSTYGGIVPKKYLDQLSYEKREDMWRELIKGKEEGDHHLVIIDEDGDIVGFAAGGANRMDESFFDGEVFAIYIAKESQGRGFGKKLLKKSFETLKKDGFNNILVWVIEDNPSREFYDAMGGKLVDEKMTDIGGAELKEVGYGWQL